MKAIIGFTLATLLLLAGCGKTSTESDKEPANSTRAGSRTSAGGGDLYASLGKALEGVKTFRARLTTTGTQVGTSEMNMDVVLPDRFRIKGDRVEMVAVGSVFYMKLPNGRWQKAQTGFDMNLANLKKLEEQLGASKEVKEVGSDLLDGVQTKVYQATITLPKQPGMPQGMPDAYVVKIWIATSDGLPRRLEGATPGSDMRTTVVYHDYNADIAITAPE